MDCHQYTSSKPALNGVCSCSWSPYTVHVGISSQGGCVYFNKMEGLLCFTFCGGWTFNFWRKMEVSEYILRGIYQVLQNFL